MTILCAPVTIVLILAMERFLSSSKPAPMMVLGLLAVGSVPWLLLAALQANARSGWPLLVGLVPWFVVEGLLVSNSAFLQAGLWIVPLGVAFYGWISTRQAAHDELAYLLDQPTSPMKDSETSSSA